MQSSIDKLTEGGFGVRVELPLDNDWWALGEQARRDSPRLPGEPDMQRHARGPVGDAMEEIAAHVLPLFHGAAQGAARQEALA